MLACSASMPAGTGPQTCCFASPQVIQHDGVGGMVLIWELGPDKRQLQGMEVVDVRL